MPDKVFFTKSVDMVVKRKGLYKDVTKDVDGFYLVVSPTEAVCKDESRLSCAECEHLEKCEARDVEKNIRKAKRPQKRRKWGEDPHFDAVMRNFGQTGNDGDEIEQQLVFGWANVSVKEDGTLPVDFQGDIIESHVLEAAAYNFVLKHGMLNQEHKWGTESGWLVESMMFTLEKMNALGIPQGTVPEGWFVGFYIPDPDVYAKVKSGEYNMFSIEGSGKRVPID